MRLIPCREGDMRLETLAGVGGLRLIEAGVIYGGDAWFPGANTQAIIEAVQHDQLLGVVGLTITEEGLNLSATMRGALGSILSLAVGPSRIYVTDETSVQLALHYGLNAVPGGRPAWLLPPENAPRLLGSETVTVAFADAIVGVPQNGDFDWLRDDSDRLGVGTSMRAEPVVYVSDDVGFAILCAILDEPCLYYAVHPWGQTNNLELLPIVRFAKEIGMQQNLCYSPEQLRERLLEPVANVPRVVVQAQRERVETTLMKLQKPTVSNQPNAVLAQVFGEGGGGGGGPRELRLGDVFDPATHYTEEYFGEGAGLLYTAADGSKQLYHGPAHEWGAFPVIFEMMKTVFGVTSGKDFLDLGCGSGAVVRHALEAGYNAFGVDISESAIARGKRNPMLAERLHCADVVRDDTGSRFEVHVLTALDFWEHIYHKDIPVLVASVKRLLKPGGIGFFIICTRGKGEQDWTIQPGDTFTKENSWLLCSGHVTIRRWGWWAQQFLAAGFKLRHDVMSAFQVLRDEDPGLRGVASWGPRNLLAVERP